MNKLPSFLSPFVKLQELDLEKEKVEKLLQSIPKKIQVLEEKIATIQREKENAREQYRSLERKQKEIENQVQECYTRVQKYKQQQMQVKKNEEYQALESEISNQHQKIETGETEELELMCQMDLEKENLASIEKTFSIKTNGIEEEIKQNRKTLDELLNKKKSLSQNIDKNREDLDRNLLADYDQIRCNLKKLPIISKIKHQICEGCHLKVSQEVMGKIKDQDTVHHCDQCGRIVY